MSLRIVRSLDLRGMYCPGPVLETAKAIKQVNVGDVIEVLASDPAAKPDLMNWAKRTGNEVVSVEDKEGYVRILIKRLK